MICQREMINQTIERYGVLTWKTLCLVRKLQMVYFFTAGKSLVVISSVHRMTVVTFIMLLLCGEIRALLNQNVASTRS